MKAVIALGANIGNPKVNLDIAVIHPPFVVQSDDWKIPRRILRRQRRAPASERLSGVRGGAGKLRYAKPRTDLLLSRTGKRP